MSILINGYSNYLIYVVFDISLNQTFYHATRNTIIFGSGETIKEQIHVFAWFIQKWTHISDQDIQLYE